MDKGYFWYGVWGLMNIGAALMLWDWFSYVNLLCGLFCFYMAWPRGKKEGGHHGKVL